MFPCVFYRYLGRNNIAIQLLLTSAQLIAVI